MDGNQELHPTREGQPEQANPTSFKEIAAPNPLSVRLKQIREGAHTRTEKLSLLLRASYQPGVTDATDEPPSLAILSSQAEELSQSELSPSEYLIRSGQLLQASEQARKRTMAEHEIAQSEHNSHQRAIRDIDYKLDELGETRGVRRLTSIFDKRKLNNQRSRLEQKATELQTHATSKRQLADQAYEKENPIRQKQEEVFLDEASSEIAAIRTDYEAFLAEVLQDGTVTKEIQDVYIHDVITPLFEESTAPVDRREAFYSALQNYLQHQSAPEEEREMLRQEVDKFAYEDGFYNVRDAYQHLLHRTDRNVVSKLVGEIAASDIAGIKTTVESRMTSYNSRYRVERAIEKAIDPEAGGWRRNDSSFREIVLSELNSRGDGNYPNIRLWGALKSSPTANELFGDLIRIEDDRIFAASLEKSLSDREGGDIDMLAYFPRPEAIRNLVILATADYSNYRTVHANWALSSLARRDNWGEILDQAQQIYPALQTVRPFLENWRYTEQSNNPGVQEAAKDFATSVLADEQADRRLASLAMQSLPNSALLEGLHQRGVIPEVATVTALKETEAFLDKLENDTHNDRLEAYRNNRETDLPYISGYYLKNAVRENLFSLMNARGDEIQTYLDTTQRLASLSQRIAENKDNYPALGYLSDHSVTQKLAESPLTIENVGILLSAYKDCPALLKNSDLRSEFCNQFSGQETVKFFNDASVAFVNHEQQLLQVIKLVGNSSLDQARALELPVKAGDILTSPSFSLAIEYPIFYLATDTDTEFFRKMTDAYQNGNDVLGQVSRAMGEGKISRELALAFPQQASTLMNDKMREIRYFVFNHADSMLKDSTDLRFLNTVGGEFGSKSDILLRGYQESLEAGVVTTADKDLVLEFGRQFRVISPTTLNGYKEAKEGGYEKVYIAQLTALAEKMTGQAIVTDEERAKPFYKDLLRHVYSNNSGQWSSFESNDSCGDRSSDIAEFKVKPRYELDLLSQSEIRVKAGESLNPKVQEEVQAPIFAVSGKMGEAGFDYEKIKTDLSEEIDKRLMQVVENGGLSRLNLDGVSTPEERLFLILSDSIYGTKTIESQVVKNLLITYEFANFDDISDYIAGTQDRVGRASNQDYALLCEVGAFYSDRIKEVNRRLVESAWNNPAIAELMPEYFKKLAQETVSTERQDKINRLQVDRLGLSDSFVRQVGKILEKRKGRKYEPDEIRSVISRYEGITGGLTEKSSTSPNPQTRAFYGQLRSQREKTMDAVRLITREEVDAAKVHLGEVNLQQVLDVEENMREGKYDEEQFASYTVQRFIDLFDNERMKIDGELDKFESISGKQREILYGYITKTKETAHARMVGGVCVAGDNPGKYRGQNMWEMPNYFQLVLQEPDTLQCQGLVLLHHFAQGDKKVLTASINPSSTYLYSVDEGALFSGIMDSLEEFATGNGFDMVTLSQNKAIRTNRTGGLFEKSLNDRVARVGKTFRFDSPQQFSFNPNYKLQDMDVVWEKAAA